MRGARLPKNKNEMELVLMLKYMTKEDFVNAVNERRFVVMNPKGNTFQAFMITEQEGNGFKQMGMANIINPDTKDGNFRQTGGGYNKAMATIEEIALYVDKHAPYDERFDGFSCYNFFLSKQNYNTI
jgi:hypothetical protein